MNSTNRPPTLVVLAALLAAAPAAARPPAGEYTLVTRLPVWFDRYGTTGGDLGPTFSADGRWLSLRGGVVGLDPLAEHGPVRLGNNADGVVRFVPGGRRTERLVVSDGDRPPTLWRLPEGGPDSGRLTLFPRDAAGGVKHNPGYRPDALPKPFAGLDDNWVVPAGPDEGWC